MKRKVSSRRGALRIALCACVAASLFALGGCGSKKHKTAAGPEAAADSAPSAKGKAVAPIDPHDMPYRVIDDQTLVAHVFAPRRSGKKAAAEPAILLFHPGGWEAGSAKLNYDDARRFAGQGFVAIAIDYRLADARHTPVAAFEDACAAFAWVRNYAVELGVDPKRVAGYGDSAGGQLVAATGTIACPAAIGDRSQTRPDLMLLVSPVLDTVHDDYAQLLRGKARAADYSPLAHAGAGAPPTLIVQGSADTRTLPVHAQDFCAKLQAAHVACRLDVFDGVGHLLTRNLKDQEGGIDPDPRMLAQAQQHEREFLAANHFVPVPPAPKAHHPSKANRP